MASTASSRFSVLKNFGDSDDEGDAGWKKVPATTNKSKAKTTKPQQISGKDTGQPSLSLPVGLSSFVVPAAQTGPHKKKKKKPTKSDSQGIEAPQQIDQEEDEELKEALLVSKREVEQMNQRWLEDERNTKLAVKISLGEAQPNASGKKKEPKKHSSHSDSLERTSKSPSTESFGTKAPNGIEDPLQAMLHQCEEEVRRILSDNKDGRSKLDPMESGVVAVYKSKLEEYAKLNVELEKQVDQLQKELTTTKDRNKKLCRVLGDGETLEKAQILVQLEKTEAVRDDLTKEVSELNGHLEQAKSRIHELETELKKTHQAMLKPHQSQNLHQK